MTMPAILDTLLHALPIEHGARIDVSEGFPVFRAPQEVQARIEALLLAQQDGSLTDEERQELDRYESLDDFLSLVNRLVRNALATPPSPAPHASAA
ncbi:MAG: hypothetical protein U0359_02515 [Byssovorax sp.]